jgi:hypothetical protein
LALPAVAWMFYERGHAHPGLSANELTVTFTGRLREGQLTTAQALGHAP